MKTKLLLALGLCITLFTQYSCSNEVEVIGIWKDIPVVYGVINRSDSVNYIRVERAYLPPNQSALEVAKNVDSLYFDTSEVDVELLTIYSNDTVLWPTPLEFVNLANEGIHRDSGIFAHSPSYAYKYIGRTGRDLLLRITNHKTNNVFYARTEMVEGTNSNIFTTPSYSLAPYRPIEWRQLNLQGDEVYGSLIVEMTGNGFASIYDYIFRFHYDEYQVDDQGNEVGGTRVDKTLEWRAASDFIPSAANQNKRTISGEAFYQYLGNTLTKTTGTKTRRCAGYIEVFIDGASASLKEYILARQANDGFVGGLHPSDPYSNVSGGYGVFASRDRLERKDRLSDPRLMRMSSLTLDHLKEGELTKDLGFESSTPCY